MKKYEWMRNDTAAIMFSAIDDSRNSRIFRISAVFKDEEIDPERLENFVNRISDMQKLDEMKVCKENTDVQLLFEALKENATIICKDKKLIYTNKSNRKTVFTDGAVLEQIITNLVSNAVRYARNEVKLDCRCIDGHLLITVADDGNGFSEEALKHATEPYFTEEDKNNGVHYGLGLSICTELCEKLDGKIRLYNDSGAVISVEI